VQHSLRVAVTDIERSGNGVRQLFLTFSANRVVSIGPVATLDRFGVNNERVLS
jgi:hypothetical protein